MPRYTDEQKAEAVELYRAVGPTEVESQLGIPKGTVTKWAKAAGVETVSDERTKAATEAIRLRRIEKREAALDKMHDRLVDILDRIVAPHEQIVVVSGGRDMGAEVERIQLDLPTAGDVQKYATAAAIMLDKIRLEAGESTDRHEVVTGVKEQVQARVDELAARRRSA